MRLTNRWLDGLNLVVFSQDLGVCYRLGNKLSRSVAIHYVTPLPRGWADQPANTVGRARRNGKVMKTLKNYFRELLVRQGERPVELVAKWNPGEVQRIRSRFRAASRSCGLGRKHLDVERNLSSQALGNRLARFLSSQLTGHLQDFTIEACAGQGYPDRRLVWSNGGRAFALELKATTRFEPKDNNRVILTSAPDKLLRWFTPPVHHLVATFRYEREGGRVRVRALRLAFLQPWTKVYVRLEASMTQRLLAAEEDLTMCDLQLN
jgi:hypothetical protein